MVVWKYENIFSKPIQYCISSEFLLKEDFVFDALRKEVVYYFFRKALSKNFLLTHFISILNNFHLK